MFSDVRWNGAISCYRSPTQSDSTDAKWAFVWSICDICREYWQSIIISHQNDTQGTELCLFFFLDGYGKFTLCYTLYVCMKYHSRRAWKEKCISMSKNIWEINQIERVEELRAAGNWKKNFILNPACVLKPCLPRSMYYLILFCMPCSLISHPSCIWFCYSHPGWHLLTSHFCCTPSLMTFMCSFVGCCKFPPELFLKLKRERERETFQFCQKAFSSWRRSSRGNSQMMTAIVKGQISPCGFASDCMFISFWSGRDSKPLSCSPHSPNSWSSACHWNRLMADPGDRGKVAVCHITSVLARKLCAVLFWFLNNVTYWSVRHTDCTHRLQISDENTILQYALLG